MSLFEIKQSNALLPKRIQENLEFQEIKELVETDKKKTNNDDYVETRITEEVMTPVTTNMTEEVMTPLTTNTNIRQTTPRRLQGREQRFFEQSMKELEEQRRQFNDMKIKFEKEMAAKEAGMLRAVRVKKRQVNNELLIYSTFIAESLTH
jgi:hypothetical protein